MKRATLAISLGSVLTLSACSSGMGDLEQYVTEVKSRKTRQIEPIPQIKQYEAFAYAGQDRRNPFVRAEPQKDPNAPGNNIRPDPNRNPEPLEEFPLDGLRMLGTINKEKSVFALVKAPDNVVHRVTLGNHMGQNYGKITAITDSSIDLVEIIPDGFGGFMERPANLALSQ
ncbi:MAG: pilus assembly protein PilP [Stagnimonas sp.]|nr:pilus assembly protein PilP [Stagnimonas sp.]